MYLLHALSSSSNTALEDDWLILKSALVAVPNTFVLNVFNDKYLKGLDTMILQCFAVAAAYFVCQGLAHTFHLVAWLELHDYKMFAINPLVCWLHYKCHLDKCFLTKQFMLGVLACSTHAGITEFRAWLKHLICWVCFANLQDLDQRNTDEDLQSGRKTLPILLCDHVCRRDTLQMVLLCCWTLWVLVEGALRLDCLWLLLNLICHFVLDPAREGYALFVSWFSHWCWRCSAHGRFTAEHPASFKLLPSGLLIG